MNALRQKLKQSNPTYGVWVTLESPNVTESLVALGIDWIVVEMEHGHLDWSDVIQHVRVCTNSNTASIVRIPELQRSYVQRALDLGADGIIVPMVGGQDQLELAFRYSRFPPKGTRGVGGERSVKWGLEWDQYLKSGEDEPVVIPLLETREAMDQADSILSVEGLEAIFFGPADMSASYGYLGQWEGPGVAEAILDVRARAASKGIVGGILGRHDEEIKMRHQQGFGMIALGADVNLMMRSVQQILRDAGE